MSGKPAAPRHRSNDLPSARAWQQPHRPGLSRRRFRRPAGSTARRRLSLRKPDDLSRFVDGTHQRPAGGDAG